MSLAHGLYVGIEDRTVTIENANIIVAAGYGIWQDLAKVASTLSQSAKIFDQSGRKYLAEGWITQIVAMRRKYSDTKTSDNLG